MGWLYWLNRHFIQAETEGARQDQNLTRDGYWKAPRVETAAALEQSAAMAERFNQMALRTLRALRDLRRYAPAVIVQNAGQVNVAGQQVNVNQSRGADHDQPR